MAILIPAGQSFTNVGGMWKMLPAPGIFVLPDMRREGQEINIYETAGVVNVTAQANLVCPGGTPGPSQPSPELITGITNAPGGGSILHPGPDPKVNDVPSGMRIAIILISLVFYLHHPSNLLSSHVRQHQGVYT